MPAETRDAVLAAIAALELQRQVLGDEVVDTSLAALREQLEASPPAGPDERRKLITVLFSDVAGFTAMSEAMDPEDVREVMTAYFARWTAAVGRYGGAVEKFIGDAVLAVFGLSTASEDDPAKAVCAALDMVRELDELNREFEREHELSLAMRVGINTGRALVAAVDERAGEFVAVGDVVNTASRLQSIAPLNGIIVSGATRQHLREDFILEALEPVDLKGKAAPTAVYLVKGARTGFGHRWANAAPGTPFLGRDDELRRLQEAFLLVDQERHSEIRTVLAETGFGKSRLLLEFERWLAETGEPVVVAVRASPMGLNVPYGMWHDMIVSHLGIAAGCDESTVVSELEAAVGDAGRAEWLSRLLGIHVSGSESRHPDPRETRDRGLAAVASLLSRLAAERPLVVLCDDVHLVDDASLDALADLAVLLAGDAVLIVLSARPSLLQRRPDWGASFVRHSRVELLRLAEATTRRLVDEVVGEAAGLDEHGRDLVASNADGNPFYVEELVRELLAGGGALVSSSASLSVPPTLISLLQARIDSVTAPTRSVLQQSAVVGRKFWAEAVAFVASGGTTADVPLALRQALESLCERAMIATHDRSALEGAAELVFRHGLLRDVAYESLTHRSRRRYHSLVASWMEAAAVASRRVEEMAAVVADHYERAAETVAARSWFRRAAANARATHANADAARFLDRAMALGSIEPTERWEILRQRESLFELIADRDRQVADIEELRLVADELEDDWKRAVASLLRSRYEESTGAYPAALASAAEAVRLSRLCGEKVVEADAEIALGAVLRRQSQFDEATEHLERALELARAVFDAGLEARALRTMGIVAESKGDYARAAEAFDGALELARRLGNLRLEAEALNSLGILRYYQQRYDEALERLRASLAIKATIGDLRGQSSSLHNLGVLSYDVGDLVAARGYLDEALASSRAMGERDGESAALLALGAVASALGADEEADKHLRRALEWMEMAHDRPGAALTLGHLARLQSRAGNHAEARRLAEQGVTIAEEAGSQREAAQALTALGTVCLEAQWPEPGQAAYRKALQIHDGLSEDDPPLEALAGAAALAMSSGRIDDALVNLEAILSTIGDGAPGGDDPAFILGICWDVAEAAALPEKATQVAEMAAAFLSRRTSGVTDPAQRRELIERVPANRALALRLGLQSASPGPP